MFTLEVGKPYNPGVKVYPEGGEYGFRCGIHELLLRFGMPTAQEIGDVSRGESEFALASVEGVLFFLYRFGQALKWSDAPYTWHLVPEDNRVPPQPPATENTRALLHVVLIDANSGIVQALRLVTLTPELTRALYEAIKLQTETPWVGWKEYDKRLAAAYRKYGKSTDLLGLATARGKGGA